MSTTSPDARVGDSVSASITVETIAALATLYDTFANAIDPDAPDLDAAEKAFSQTVALAFDYVSHDLGNNHRLTLREFRREVIRRCKLHLKATERISTISPKQ